MSDAAAERVLVVPTELFHRVGHFQGFSKDVAGYLEVLLDPQNVSFRPRGEVEQDPSFKQLIPYVIFRYSDDSKGTQLFQYTRSSKQDEGRLRRKRSVGVGGHISAADAAAASGDAYREWMQRELAEEVVIDTPYTEQCVGLINDDLTDVGRVHLGVVHLCTVERPAVVPREAEMVESGFQPLEQLFADLPAFETWSHICLEALFSPA